MSWREREDRAAIHGLRKLPGLDREGKAIVRIAFVLRSPMEDGEQDPGECVHGEMSRQPDVVPHGHFFQLEPRPPSHPRKKASNRDWMDHLRRHFHPLEHSVSINTITPG